MAQRLGHTLKEENKLLIAERKVLWKILETVQRQDGRWRARINTKIEELIAQALWISQSLLGMAY